MAMVAGETSGDLLAGLLLDGLKSRWPGVQSLGIGGPQMMRRGFQAVGQIDVVMDSRRDGREGVRPYQSGVGEERGGKWGWGAGRGRRLHADSSTGSLTRSSGDSSADFSSVVDIAVRSYCRV